jgi:hypothetical protein
MTPKHFSDRFCFYTIYLRKIAQKNIEEKKKIVRSHLSPGMQEHVAEHREKSRNTCTKKYTICILYNQKKRTYSQPLFASIFLTLCLNLSNFHTSSHVPREMFHMASLVYSKIWDFHFFCIVLYSLQVHNGLLKCPKCHTRFFSFLSNTSCINRLKKSFF